MSIQKLMTEASQPIAPDLTEDKTVMLTLYKDIKLSYLENTLKNGLTPHKRLQKHEERLNKILERHNLPTRDEVIFAYLYEDNPWWGGCMKYLANDKEHEDIATIKISKIDINDCYIADAKMVNEAWYYSNGERDYWYLDTYKKFNEALRYFKLPDGSGNWAHYGHYNYIEILINMKHIKPEQISLVRVREAKELTI